MATDEKLSSQRTAKQKRSAISKVEMSGLELVRKRKTRGRPPTIRQMAKLDWQPWEKAGKLVPTTDRMNYIGFYCRVSTAIMTRTKAELMQMHAGLEHKVVDEMVAGLTDTAETLKVLASVAESAYARVLVSASAHHVVGRKVQGSR